MDTPDLGTVPLGRRWTRFDWDQTEVAHHGEGCQQDQAPTGGLCDDHQKAIWVLVELVMDLQRESSELSIDIGFTAYETR